MKGRMKINESASVIFFNEGRLSGQVNLEGSRRPTWFRYEDHREVGAGNLEPFLKTTGPQTSRLPFKKDRLVCEVELVPHRLYFGKPVYRVVGWAFLEEWQKTERKIAARPVYQVIRQVFVNGHRAPNDNDVFAFGGTLEQLRETFPKGLPAAMKPMENVYLWESRQPNGEFKPCGDPTVSPVQIVVAKPAEVVHPAMIAITEQKSDAVAVPIKPAAKSVAMPKKVGKPVMVVKGFDALGVVLANPIADLVAADDSVRVGEPVS